MPRHTERWMGWRQARGPRRPCGSVAVPRAGRGGGCHGIRNRSIYLIRTGLASCRPDTSARGMPVCPGRDAVRRAAWPAFRSAAVGPAWPLMARPCGRPAKGPPAPVSAGGAPWAKDGPCAPPRPSERMPAGRVPTGGRAARRVQKRPGKPRPSAGSVVRARPWRRCAGRPRRRSFPR